MRKRAQKFRYSILATVLLLVVSLNLGHAQTASTQIAYLLSLDELGWRGCRVSLTIENIQQEYLIFSLPDWIPGWNPRVDAAAKIVNLKMEGAENSLLSFEQLAPGRWLVETADQTVIRVTYDVKIPESDLPAHKLNARGALLQSRMIFLRPESHQSLPMYLRLMVPETWKVATSLHPTSYANEFSARNYDELISSPILIGDFQDFYFRHDEKTINVVINQFRNQSIDRFLGSLRKIVRTQSQIFNELPSDTYIFMCEFQSPAQPAVATGFRDACVIQCSADAVSENLNNFAPQIAREIFRVWNGTRIRPATAQIGTTRFTQTNLLWFSEGVTQYYGDLTLVRSGIWDETELLQQIGLRIARVKENPLNSQMPIDAASLVCETGNSARTELYENRGYLVALLLDLKIRQITRNAHSLDHVFQWLNWGFAKDDLPITQVDVLRTVNAVSQSDFSRFFARYISGVKELPLDELLQHVGLTARISRKTVADWGEWPRLNPKNQIIKIDENSLLAQAGLKKGAQIVGVDSVKISSPEAFFELAAQKKENSEVLLHIQQNDTPATIPVKTGQKNQYNCVLTNLAEPTPGQIQNRQLWLQAAADTPNF